MIHAARCQVPCNYFTPIEKVTGGTSSLASVDPAPSATFVPPRHLGSVETVGSTHGRRATFTIKEIA